MVKMQRSKRVISLWISNYSAWKFCEIWKPYKKPAYWGARFYGIFLHSVIFAMGCFGLNFGKSIKADKVWKWKYIIVNGHFFYKSVSFNNKPLSDNKSQIISFQYFPNYLIKIAIWRSAIFSSTVFDNDLRETVWARPQSDR